KLESKTPFDAQHALTRIVLWCVVRADDRVLFGDVEFDATPDAAIRAGGVDTFDGIRSNLLWKDGARWTGGETRAARRTDRLAQRLVLERADLHRLAAAQQRDGADVLHLVAGRHAARAEDALLHVEHKERVAGIGGPDVPRLHRVGQRKDAAAD